VINRLFGSRAAMVVLLVGPLLIVVGGAGPGIADSTTRVSVNSDAVEGNSLSEGPSISPSGRFVAFQSRASNLVPGDTNGVGDVFVHDRRTGLTTRVSVNSVGDEGDLGSFAPSISGNGRYVAFSSDASNLVPGDTNGISDVFVHDRNTGLTTRISVDSAGEEATNETFFGSSSPSISDSGRFVAFSSFAGNLVLGDTNGTSDIFVHNRKTGVTTRVSVDSAGEESNSDSVSPSISASGRFVAFRSFASNLVPGDTNGVSDIFVHDRKTGVTTRVSVDSAGEESNGICDAPSISGDGRYVAFQSDATNLVPGDTNGTFDIFVHDRKTGLTTRVSRDSAGEPPNGPSFTPSISANGRFVAFWSFATNLVPGDTNGVSDIFVYDRKTGITTRASVDSSGQEATGGVKPGIGSLGAAISANGRGVAFTSFAGNLVPGDTNGTADIFVHDRR